jgi:hypothetical protein
MKFADRLDPATFADDEVVGVALCDRDIPSVDLPESAWVFIPERLFNRLLLLGRAYSLHFAELVDAQAESSLNSTQCEGAAEELHFLEQVVGDAALTGTLKELVSRVERAASTGMSLRFSPP